MLHDLNTGSKDVVIKKEIYINKKGCTGMGSLFIFMWFFKLFYSISIVLPPINSLNTDSPGTGESSRTGSIASNTLVTL